MKIKKFFSDKSILQGDAAVWMIFLLLCMVSVIEVYSASSRMTFGTGQYWRPIVQHGSYIGLGILAAWVIHRIPCNYFKIGGTFVMHLIAYPLLVWAFFAPKTNDAARWVDMGIIKMQPSEVAKISLVVFSAFILASLRDEKGASGTAFKIVAVEALLTIMLIAPENASTAGILFLVILGICFFAQVRTKILAWIVCAIIGGGAFALTAANSIPEETLVEWRKSDSKLLHRAQTWVHRITDKNELPEDPAKYNLMDNQQVTHATIAVATCNIVGKGPGNSVQRDFLPQAFSDFIYAIIIEELGIFGGGGVMFLYLLLMYRAMKIASRCKALFPSYLVMGLSLMMVVQAMVNMAVAVGAFPVTGQPLPLISRGGTSIFVNCAYIGMILSVSRSAKKISEEDTTKKAPDGVGSDGD